jgi:thioredoxin reductase (NADPH)
VLPHCLQCLHCLHRLHCLHCSERWRLRSSHAAARTATHGGVQVDLNQDGYVLVRNGCETSVPGVFSAGDLHDTEWRQAVTAAGSGCMSAIAAERYLTANGLIVEFKPEGAKLGRGVDAAQESEVEEEEPQLTAEAPFDAAATRHKGQYALRKLYHESERLIVVMYSSPSCGPCRSLKPMVSAVVREFEDKLHYVEIDIAQDPEIAEAAGVMGTPTIHFFKQKERVENISGVKMKSEWRKLFAKYTEEQTAVLEEKVEVTV